MDTKNPAVRDPLYPINLGNYETIVCKSHAEFLVSTIVCAFVQPPWFFCAQRLALKSTIDMI